MKKLKRVRGDCLTYAGERDKIRKKISFVVEASLLESIFEIIFEIGGILAWQNRI